jgi:hypothetical protein
LCTNGSNRQDPVASISGTDQSVWALIRRKARGDWLSHVRVKCREIDMGIFRIFAAQIRISHYYPIVCVFEYG